MRQTWGDKPRGAKPGVPNHRRITTPTPKLRGVGYHGIRQIFFPKTIRFVLRNDIKENPHFKERGLKFRTLCCSIL